MWWGSLLFLLLFCPLFARADFRNQMAALDATGLTEAETIQYAKDWGYEWVLGNPWSPAKASAAITAGLKVSFNSNADRQAKWYRFDNPGDASTPAEPTLINIGTGNQSISTALYDELKIALCMTSAGVSMADNDLYNPVTKVWKYKLKEISNSTITFYTNYYSNTAVATNVAANMRLKNLHESAAGKTLYTGLYFDEVTFPEADVPNCLNPGHSGNSQSLYDAGRKKFIKDLTDEMALLVGGTWAGRSGNPYQVTNFEPEQTDANILMNLIHSESSGGIDCDNLTELQAGVATGCGTQNTAIFANTSPSAVQLQLSPSNYNNQPNFWFDASYPGALLIAGRGAWQSMWLGWFGAVRINFAVPGTHLLRAIPNWDNMRGATSRVWTEATDTYTSTNSRMDPTIAWSRHRLYDTNHKLYVVRNSGSPTITLNANEKVVNAKCTDSLFRETAAVCNTSAFFSQSGTTVTLGGSIVNGNGYILTVHRQPTLLSTTLDTADQLDLCLVIDDAPTPILPANNPTGFTVVVGGTAKVPIAIARTGVNCYRMNFSTNAILAGQTVTLQYTSGTGNVTSGTDMVNGAGKVPAASFGPTSVVNTIGGGGGGIPLTTQTRYQWGQIDGPTDTAALYTVTNDALRPSPGGRARLYVKMRNTVNTHTAVSFPLYFAVDPANQTDPSLGVPLTDVCTPTTVCYTPVSGVSDPTLTTERLSSDETNNVFCRVVDSSDETPTLTLPAASETECVYAIKFGASLTFPQRVYFYPRQSGGVLLDGYVTSNLPHANMQTHRSDQTGGTMTGGSRQ